MRQELAKVFRAIARGAGVAQILATRFGGVAPSSGQRAGHAQPGCDSDQPAVQRRRDTGRAVPLLAAGTARRRLTLMLIA
jgi:hypothetical protein